jgi:hypothetical protein
MDKKGLYRDDIHGIVHYTMNVVIDRVHRGTLLRLPSARTQWNMAVVHNNWAESKDPTLVHLGTSLNTKIIVFLLS